MRICMFISRYRLRKSPDLCHYLLFSTSQRLAPAEARERNTLISHRSLIITPFFHRVKMQYYQLRSNNSKIKKSENDYSFPLFLILRWSITIAPFLLLLQNAYSIAACAAAKRAIGTRNGEQET